MIRTLIDLTTVIPVSREKAALVAQAASRYTCMLTLEGGDSVLNVKSMIGLLSQSIPSNVPIYLVADGQDEDEATKAVFKAIVTKL